MYRDHLVRRQLNYRVRILGPEVDDAMPSPTEITVPQLARLIGLPTAPVLLDVRTDDEFAADPMLIPTALRYGERDHRRWPERLRGARVVVACRDGLAASQGRAALLRHAGVAAESLVGGYVAWAAGGQPLVRADRLPARDEAGRTLWVTRARPKVVRIACPWLIRRFIDPAAVFLFVAPSEVAAVAARFNATPFDAGQGLWSDRGEACTFDLMIDQLGLRTEPLLRLAEIVRGADTGRLDLTPQSAGLLAVSLGYSRMFRDDLAQLEAGMSVYDGLYRWARDAADETHS